MADTLITSTYAVAEKPYQLGLYEKAMPSDLSWEEKFSCAREAGFDYVEISIDETDAKQARLSWTKAERAEVLRAMDATGMALGSMCLSGHRKWPFGAHDEQVRAYAHQMMQGALDLACDLGIHTIQLAGYDVYYEESDADTLRWFAEGLRHATELAARAGVVMGFETMETPFMDTVAKAMHYVDEINSPYLGVYPDVGNLTNASFIYGTSVADDLKTGVGHLVAAHLKETVKGAYREIPFGTGTTDYEGGLSVLIPAGVRRFVAEMWYVGQESWKQDIAFANSYVRGKVDAALKA